MAAALVKKRQRDSTMPEFARDGSLRLSHQAVAQTGRGLVRVWWMRLSAQTPSKAPRYSLP
jgi:hypothetical protein